MVDEERPSVPLIDCEKESEKDNTPQAGGKPREFDPVKTNTVVPGVEYTPFAKEEVDQSLTSRFEKQVILINYVWSGY